IIEKNLKESDSCIAQNAGGNRKSGHRPIKPPLYHKQSGRPKKARTRPVDEIPKGATKLRRYGIVIHCSVCGGEGHNATNCGREYGIWEEADGEGEGKEEEPAQSINLKRN
ncbi:PREDICTED: transposon, partial [Prunus dulcis]